MLTAHTNDRETNMARTKKTAPPVGTELGDGLRVGHGGTLTQSPVALYSRASRGDGQARYLLASLSREEREQIAPPGIQGTARQTFIDTGQTFGEQLQTAQAARIADDDQQSTTNHKEADMATQTTSRKSTARTRKGQGSQPKTARNEKRAAEGISTRELAERIGTDPRTLRVFLRSQDTRAGRGSRHAFTKGEATKIEKAFRKAHAA